MNEFICILKPTRLQMLTDSPTEEEERLVGEHFLYWKGLFEDKKVRLAGKTQNNDEKTFGIILFNSESLSEAKALIQNDPVIIYDVMTFEVFEFSLALG